MVAHPLYSVYMFSQQIYCGNTYKKHGYDRCTYIMYIHGDNFNVVLKLSALFCIDLYSLVCVRSPVGFFFFASILLMCFMLF